MLNTPEGLRMRQAALGLVMAAGAISLQASETDNPVVAHPVTIEHEAAQLSPDNLALIQEQRDEPQRASRSHRESTPAPTSSAPPPKSSAKNIGSFESTCYNLRGETASGKSAGYGKVAVDPRIIPLGTRLHIEGYGDAVAADTGGLIKGRIIDVWKPSTAACRNWGRRIVEVAILP